MTLNLFQKNLKDMIRELVQQEINKNMFVDLYRVEKLYTYEDSDDNTVVKELTCDIVQMNGIQKFKEVPILGNGLGNGKGAIFPPSKDDIVLVIFYGQTNAPIILGNVFNTFMRGNRLTRDENNNLVFDGKDNNDSILDVGEGEWILINQINDSYIFKNSDGEIIIKTKTDTYDVGGTDYTESFIHMKKDGEIYVQCKGGIGNLAP